MEAILFFSEDVNFSVNSPQKLTRWVKKTIAAEQYKLSFLNFIFCSDSYLLSVNQQYLQHSDYTDVITFNYSDDPFIIEGDVFISIDRIRENAHIFNIDFGDELHRVMIHGVLHLLGYSDKSESERQIMREKEDSYLSLFIE